MTGWNVGDPGVVELPDGRTVRGASRRAARGFQDDVEQKISLCRFRPRKIATGEYWIRWADFRAPHSTAQALALLEQAYEQAATERVLIVCRGGSGRTGTALAVLAILGGVAPRDAVAWIRQLYRQRAVETVAQRKSLESICPNARS